MEGICLNLPKCQPFLFHFWFNFTSLVTRFCPIQILLYNIMQLLKVQVKTLKPNLVRRKVKQQLFDCIVVVFLELYSGPAHTVCKLTRPLINKTFLYALVYISLYNNKWEHICLSSNPKPNENNFSFAWQLSLTSVLTLNPNSSPSLGATNNSDSFKVCLVCSFKIDRSSSVSSCLLAIKSFL